MPTRISAPRTSRGAGAAVVGAATMPRTAAATTDVVSFIITSLPNEDRVTLDRDRIQAQPATSAGQRTAGEEIELPAVPRARQDLSLPPPAELAGERGQRRS